MARRSKHDPAKRRKLPEPRYRKPDDPFEELTKDVTADKFAEKSEPEAKSLGIRRSKRPFEAAKEEEDVEESLRQPEYGKAKRTRRRITKRT